jgi:hypothetical protein
MIKVLMPLTCKPRWLSSNHGCSIDLGCKPCNIQESPLEHLGLHGVRARSGRQHRKRPYSLELGKDARFWDRSWGLESSWTPATQTRLPTGRAWRVKASRNLQQPGCIGAIELRTIALSISSSDGCYGCYLLEEKTLALTPSIISSMSARTGAQPLVPLYSAFIHTCFLAPRLSLAIHY